MRQRSRELAPNARRFIDGDKAAGIERNEEEVVPTFQHAAHGSGIVEVGVAVTLELEEIAERRD